jgi:hypothetical protein
MASRNTLLTESASLDDGREAFRLRSYGCTGYTVGVSAALLCMVSTYTGKPAREIGELTGQDLWTLARAGFMSTITIPEIPKPVRDYLCLGEKAAIKVGLWLLQDSIPTGETIGEICEACAFDISTSMAIISGDGELSLNA